MTFAHDICIKSRRLRFDCTNLKLSLNTPAMTTCRMADNRVPKRSRDKVSPDISDNHGTKVSQEITTNIRQWRGVFFVHKFSQRSTDIII